MGNIDIRLKRVNSNGWSLSVRDDGTGLQVDRIRQKLLKLGWFNQKELDGMSNKEIALQIFRPDFSTAKNITMHAGRGSGLDLVVNNINQLNKPHLNVSSRPGLYTEFALTFSV
jgi:chemotaxis protein histidine kinase CheA